MNNHLDLASVLEQLEIIGGRLKLLSDPANLWGNPDRNQLWAKRIFKPKLKQTRAAYAAIQRGGNIEQILRKLKAQYICGPEYLKICEILGDEPVNHIHLKRLEK